MRKLKIVHFDNKKYEVKEIDNDLDIMRELVGGYLETFPITKRLLLVCDEDAKRKETASPNVMLCTEKGSALIFGPCFVIARDETDFASLTDDDIEVIKSRYKFSERADVGVLYFVY